MNTKANIIIIEDEKNICNFIETVLSPQGYQVTSAYTGTDGLKLIESLKPDVVLLDPVSYTHLPGESLNSRPITADSLNIPWNPYPLPAGRLQSIPLIFTTAPWQKACLLYTSRCV